jgi:hypothetical protein
MTLGEALVQHRTGCSSCTPDRGCGRYLAIAREHTEARQVYVGPRAACMVLSVRENPGQEASS